MQSPYGMEDISDRLETELSLLEAMYPQSMTFTPSTSEVHFKPSESPGSHLVLRLPEDYPLRGKPQVILACDRSRQDVRTKIINVIDEFGDDEEILDAVIQRFSQLLQSRQPEFSTDDTHGPAADTTASKTVIIWLHHLLATSKRKLALHPSLTTGRVSGITKPGYPGVMVFTGPRDAVDEHVAELKGLNWQAFQVRYEEDEAWKLHGGEAGSIAEVETMAELVQQIEEEHRQQFLKALGVK